MAVAAPSMLAVHELMNARGDRVRLLNFGARICSIRLEVADGAREVVLGYPERGDYLHDRQFMGCTIGRFANRIRRSQFTIAGTSYLLVANDGPHHLHGGRRGFDQLFWELEAGADRRSARYRILSADGDQGYPGALAAAVSYGWTDDRELLITFTAETDKPTPVSLTNHVYFNLDREQSDVLDHRIRIDSRQITEVDPDGIPNGRLACVEETPLDLRSGKRIGEVIRCGHPLMAHTDGVDLNYVLQSVSRVAELSSASGDLDLVLDTTYPGLQFYCGQNLTAPFPRFGGVCLEPQFHPDSPNQPGFPDALLRPGEVYRHTACYRFVEHR